MEKTTTTGRTVVIHQPDFLPYLGFFHRLLQADLLVMLDSVQFVQSGGWIHRDKIKTRQGEGWITISVKKSPLNTAIREIELAQFPDWRNKNLDLIRENYRKAPYFNEIYPYLEHLYHRPCSRLVEFNMHSIEMLAQLFDISLNTQLASDLSCEGRKNQLLVNILKVVGASHYLSGVGAKDYFDPEPFRLANIEVIWQDFKHPMYSQLHGKFIPYLSSIDLFFNCGIERSRQIIRD
jgi:hypothetical protein